MGKKRHNASAAAAAAVEQDGKSDTSDAPKNRLEPRKSFFELPSKETVQFVLQSAGKGAVVQTFVFLVILAVGKLTLAVAGINVGLYLFFMHEGVQLNMNARSFLGKPDLFHFCMSINILIPFIYLMHVTVWDPEFSHIAICIFMQWLFKLLCFVSFPREVTEIQ